MGKAIKKAPAAGNPALLDAAMKKLREGLAMTVEEKAAFERWDGYASWNVRIGHIYAYMEDGSATPDDYRWFIRWGGFSADCAVRSPHCPPEIIAEGLTSENRWVREGALESAFRRGIRFAVAK